VQALATRLGQSPDSTARQLSAVADQLFPMPPLASIILTSLTGGRSNIPTSGDIPPGDYAVDFQSFAKTVAYPKELTFNGIKLSGQVLRIAPASPGNLYALMARDVATIAVTVADAVGKPVPYATVMLIPDSATSAPQLSRFSVHGTTDQNGSYTSPPLVPGKYKVLATAQTVLFNVPDDLERLLLVMFQSKNVEVAPKSTLQVAVAPIAIY